jgi:hypothetical protein
VLAPHAALDIQVPANGEVTISSDIPVIDAPGTSSAGTVTGSLSSAASLLLTGPRTSVAFYNPDSVALQITGASVRRTGSRPFSASVPPGATLVVPIRVTGGGPVGLTLTATAPFVAAPVS